MSSANDLRNLLDKIDEKRVAELVRRVAIPVASDGYPTSSMPEHSSGGGHSDPTSATATSAVDRERTDGNKRTDPLSADLRHLESELAKAHKVLRGCVGVLDGVQRKLVEKAERPATVPCSICETLPAEKAAWCMSDYNDWWKHGSPDRLLWEMYRRQDVDDAGVLRVPNAPPPSEGHTAIRGEWRASVGF